MPWFQLNQCNNLLLFPLIILKIHIFFSKYAVWIIGWTKTIIVVRSLWAFVTGMAFLLSSLNFLI